MPAVELDFYRMVQQLELLMQGLVFLQLLMAGLLPLIQVQAVAVYSILLQETIQVALVVPE
jgi:hypothetical protein